MPYPPPLGLARGGVRGVAATPPAAAVDFAPAGNLGPGVLRVDRQSGCVTVTPTAARFLALLVAVVVSLAQRLQRSAPEQQPVAAMWLDVVGNGCRCATRRRQFIPPAYRIGSVCMNRPSTGE